MDDKFEVKKESLDNENFDVLKQEENKFKLEDDKEEEEKEEEIIDSDVEQDKMIKIKHKKTNKKEEEEEEEEEDEEIYCICKTSDIDRFMIACDKCGEWYHGNCIGVKRKHAKKIKDWFCSFCKELDPTLETIFKEKKHKKIVKPIETPAEARKEKEKDDTKEREKDQKRISRSCGDCSACLIKEDCSHCDYCKDMRKFGGPGKLRQKCRSRQCHTLSKANKKGVPTNKKKSSKENKEFEKISWDSSHITEEHSYTSLIKQSPNHSDQDGTPAKDDFFPSNELKKKALKVKRANVNKNTGQRGKEKKESKRSSNNRKHKSSGNKTENYEDDDVLLAAKLQKIEWLASRTTRSAKKVPSSLNRKEKVKEDQKPRHCLGPGCVNPARNFSKYCSHECGIQLQIRRLQVILPTRGLNCSPTYHANVLAEEKIQKCLEIQQSCQDTLLELDKNYQSLEELIQRSSGFTVQDEDQNEEDKDGDLDLTTYCVSCGIPLAPRIAFRHMEKCWAKLECLMSFGAVMKSAGNLFCDTYMVQQKTFCKRLKVMCPEHYKEGKIEADEVCGCPLVDEQQEETDQLCRLARKKCTRHVAWRRLKRGEIDLKRVHQWWKLEEAYEQERQLRIEMSRRGRGNILAVMFNETFDHTYNKSAETAPHNDILRNDTSSDAPSPKQTSDTRTSAKESETLDNDSCLKDTTTDASVIEKETSFGGPFPQTTLDHDYGLPPSLTGV